MRQMGLEKSKKTSKKAKLAVEIRIFLLYNQNKQKLVFCQW